MTKSIPHWSSLLFRKFPGTYFRLGKFFFKNLCFEGNLNTLSSPQSSLLDTELQQSPIQEVVPVIFAMSSFLILSFIETGSFSLAFNITYKVLLFNCTQPPCQDIVVEPKWSIVLPPCSMMVLPGRILIKRTCRSFDFHSKARCCASAFISSLIKMSLILFTGYDSLSPSPQIFNVAMLKAFIFVSPL